MDGMFGLLAAPVVGSIVYLVMRLHLLGRSRAFLKAARSVGLTNVQSPSFFGLQRKVTGSADGLDVTLETYQRGKYEHGTRIVIGGLRHGAYGLSLRAEGLTSAIQKSVGDREIELGDPAFDAAAFLLGDPGLIRALFDAETRRLIGALLDKGLPAESPEGSKTFKRLRVSVSGNELRVEIRSSLFDRTDEWLPSILSQLLAIAGRLRRPDDLAARLAANARGDALAAVRLANLRTLSSDFSGQAATHDALLAGLGDDSPEVRLHAAMALGSEGREPLFALASADVPDDVAARAIAALGPAFPQDRAIGRLREVREIGRTATALACIEVLSRAGGGAGATDALVETLASSAEALAVAAARALGSLGGEPAETALVAALDRESGLVRVAAADALGRVGTPRAVAPLRQASESHLLDGDLRRSARQSIAEIQSRVTGASPGQLSLAGEHVGQVTLVEEDTRGQLSLEEPTDVAVARRAAQAAKRAGAAQRAGS